MTISRRKLGLGLAALGACAANGAVAAPRRTRLDVLILGGGISGLHAAWLLEQKGAKVAVLEGRSRIGGRVYTLTDQPGYPEMGFNTMGSGYVRGIDAARRAGVELVDVGQRLFKAGRQELVMRGKVLSREAWAASADNPFPPDRKKMMPWEIVGAAVARNNPLKDAAGWLDPQNSALDISMHAFLSQQGLSDAAIRLAFDTSPYYGTTADDVSALMYEFNAAWGRSQAKAGAQSLAVKGGNQKLTDGMGRLIKGDIALGKTVVAIESHKTGVKAICADRSIFEARYAVCALPFSTLRKIHFQPGLAALQARAVASIPYQAISIAFLTVKSPFWEQDQLAPSMWTDGPLGSVYAQYFGADENQVTGFTVQARGKLSREWDAMGHDAAMAMIVREFEALRPAARGLVTPAALQSWTADPFSLGDWAYFSPGQITRFIGKMSKPADRVHFCGEHTALANRGLEGALESAERMAVELAGA